MARAKKQVKKVVSKVVQFKDLEVDKLFTYKGDECLCEVQEDDHTIFDNRVENKRYKIENGKVVE